MRKTDTKESVRLQLGVLLPIALIVGLGFLAAYQFVKPAPPDSLVLSAGRDGGAYFAHATRYAEILAREGISVQVVESAGSLENLQRLQARTNDVQAAFVQGGAASTFPASNLVALGSLYYEPLWLFSRQDAPVHRATGLAGKRVAAGEVGSGTRLLALEIMTDNGVDEDDADIRPLAGGAAAQGLIDGDVDAVFLVASAESSSVRTLLSAEGILPTSFERAPAYTQRHRYLSSVTLAEGMIDLRDNIPARPITLLATTATLVVRHDLHPALIDLLLQAAREIHGEGGMFEQPGDFPAATHVEFPLSKEAQRFYQYGPPFLQRYLPFWAATLIDRLKVMILPLLVLMIPLLRFAPSLYRWRVRARIYRWYEQVNEVEDEIETGGDGTDTGRLLHRLDRLENEATQVPVPLSYMDQMYHLRTHIEYVRNRLR